MAKYVWRRSSHIKSGRTIPTTCWVAEKRIGFFSFTVKVYKAIKYYTVRYEDNDGMTTMTGLETLDAAMQWAEENI